MRPHLTLLTLALAHAKSMSRKGAKISDEDSCPPPPANIGSNSLLGPIHSCSWCVSRISKPAEIAPDADWVRLAFVNEASKPVQLHEATVNGPATAVQTFEGWSAHQDQSNGQTEHRVVANATGPAGGEVAVGLPVAPGKEITFRARHGTLLRARAIDDGELLLEHRVGRVRMVAEAPADAHAHAFGLDDSDEWRSNLPPPKPLAKPPSSAPGAKKPPRVAPVKPGKLKEDHRFQVAFLNHLPVPLDLYYYAPKEGTETLQSRAAPFETLQIVTYWRAHFVVRDPVSGLRAAQLAIPVMPIRDCGKEKADAFAARYLRDAVAVGIHAPDDVNATGADSIGVSSLAEQLVVAEDASK